MDYKTLISTTASICIAVGAFCAFKYKDWGKPCANVATVCYLAIILLKSLELTYSFSITGPFIIFVTSLSLYFNVKVVGQDQVLNAYSKASTSNQSQKEEAN